METVKFEIKTEYIESRQEIIEKLVGRYFDSFTIYRHVGFWQGKKEQSITIEIIGPDSIETYYATQLRDDTPTIERLAKLIKIANNQESVLIVKTDIDAVFV